VKPRVCIFAKLPVPGEVKTRLAPTLGDAAAARLARAFLRDAVALVRRALWAKAVLAVPGGARAMKWTGIEVWDQGEGDLGERLSRVLTRALRGAPFAIALGADSPGLPLARLDDARSALEWNDAVLGPAQDGGFYLLGLRRCPRGLLNGLRWGHRRVLEQTRARLRQRGLRVALLEAWFDVDRPGDLARLGRLLEAGEVRAKATVRELASLRLLRDS